MIKRNFLRSLFAQKHKPIVIVSGLPRSGTSMMMRMLEAGGLPLLTDGLREANVDNPEGYYEFERVKQLREGDVAWLDDARGKGVKVIAALLAHLPADYEYRVLFMQRRMGEVLASQRKMLVRRGEDPDRISDEELAGLMERHVEQVQSWLAGRSNFTVLHVDYNAMLIDPAPHIRQISAFLPGFRLNETAMADVVNPELYRNRV